MEKDVIELRKAYLTPFIPYCPAIGRAEKADCVWGLAFGRNTYTDGELGNIMKYLEETHPGDLPKYEWLANQQFCPGRPNEALALQAWRVFDAIRRPVFAQWEITYAMWNQRREYYSYLHRSGVVHAIWAPSNLPYFSTFDVIVNASLLTGSQKFPPRRPLLLGHTAHLPRVVAVAWKAGWNITTTSEEILDWDERSVQPATRRFTGKDPRDCWLPRETVARLIHHPLKRIVSLTPPRPRQER